MTLSLPRPDDLRVRDHDDLRLFWQAVIDSEGLAGRTLWLALFTAGGRPLPLLIPIDDVPAVPDGLVANLGAVVGAVAADHSLVAVATLLARPGPTQVTATDRRWATVLYGEHSATLRVWPTHLATRGGVVSLDPRRPVLV